MILNFDISIEDAIELYFTHYQYGLDYSSTTVLVDANYNIIAFYDHQTPNIDVIMVNLFYRGEMYVANGTTVHSPPPKFLYYNYDGNNHKNIEWRRINSGIIASYNENYFREDYINKQPPQLLGQTNEDTTLVGVEMKGGK